MSVDGFTFVAQILNFVILVALLRRFLYRPVLAAVDDREAAIRTRLEAAAARERAAGERAAAHTEELEALERTRAARLREAEDAAEALRRDLTREVREEARSMRDEWRAAVRREREDFLAELRRRMAEEVYVTLRSALGDLADADLDDRVITVFLERLATLPDEERARFLGEARAAGGRIRVRTAFAPVQARRSELTRVIAAWAAAPLEPHFEVAPDLAAGVELVAGDRKIGWSAASYLDALAASTAELLDAGAG